MVGKMIKVKSQQFKIILIETTTNLKGTLSADNFWHLPVCGPGKFNSDPAFLGGHYSVVTAVDRRGTGLLCEEEIGVTAEKRSFG